MKFHIAKLVCLVAAAAATLTIAEEALRSINERSLPTPRNGASEEALCDLMSTGCDVEDDFSYDEMMLLQMDLRLKGMTEAVITSHGVATRRVVASSDLKETSDATSAQRYKANVNATLLALLHSSNVSVSMEDTVASSPVLELMSTLEAIAVRHGVISSASSAAVPVAVIAIVIVILALLVACLWTNSRQFSEPKSVPAPQKAAMDSRFSTTGRESRMTFETPKAQPSQHSRKTLPPTAGSTAQAYLDPSRQQLQPLMYTDAQARPSALSRGSAADREVPGHGLPPICKSLILPHTEVRFTIAMDQLVRFPGTGQLSITGTSGRALLSVTVADTVDGRRSLQISSAGCEGEARATVLSQPVRFSQSPLSIGSAEQREGLEILGRADAENPSGKPYGTLQISQMGGSCLIHNGQPVMYVEVHNMQELKMVAKALDDRELASAGRNQWQKNKPGDDTWKVQVKATVDAVLVTACMLSMILLRNERSSLRPSVQAPTRMLPGM